jgi:hypothetical protein
MLCRSSFFKLNVFGTYAQLAAQRSDHCIDDANCMETPQTETWTQARTNGSGACMVGELRAKLCCQDEKRNTLSGTDASNASIAGAFVFVAVICSDSVEM